jgi:hypothetical protein
MHNGKVNSITHKGNHQKRGIEVSKSLLSKIKYTTQTSSSVNATIKASELTRDAT